VCPNFIKLNVEDDKLVDVEFLGGGCSGNLKALKKVVIGMKCDDIVKLFSNITCGIKGTSCMDQLTKAIESSKSKVE